jgi:hypothetical protein
MPPALKGVLKGARTGAKKTADQGIAVGFSCSLLSKNQFARVLNLSLGSTSAHAQTLHVLADSISVYGEIERQGRQLLVKTPGSSGRGNVHPYPKRSGLLQIFAGLVVFPTGIILPGGNLGLVPEGIGIWIG